MNDKLAVRVDNRLRFQAADVPSWLLERLKDTFTHTNPKYAAQQAMGYYVGNLPRFIQTWEVRSGEVSLPRGGNKRFRELLVEADLTPSYDVRVSDGEPCGFPSHRITLEPFQQRVVDGVTARHNCLVQCATGSGKTTIAINLISRLQRTTIVMLWTGALLKQWQDRVVTELGMDKADVGVIGGGKFEPRPLTLAMQQTVHSMLKRGDQRLAPLFSYFGVFIADEVQRWGADSLIACTEPFSARYRVGLSADPTRHDHREFLIYDVFGDVATEVSTEQLVEDGVVLDVAVRVVLTDFRADWYREEFLEDGSRNPRYQDFNALLDAMCGDPARNAVVLGVIERGVKDGSVLVFSHRVEHCRQLDSLCVSRNIQSGLMIGGMAESRTFRDTKERLTDGRVRVGIGTYGAIGQGIDVPAVSRGVIATPVNNNRQKFGQARGRMARANRAGSIDAELWYALDHHVFGLRPLRNLMAWNKSVTVWDGGRWVDAKDYMANARREASLFG
jgi:superfamily II DNA or RNA helicase